MLIQPLRKIALFSALILSLMFFSCSTLKIKEKEKQSEVKTFAGIDTTKTKQTAAGSLTTINENKNFTIYKTDTIVKIDSIYFRIPITRIQYSDGKQTVIHDTLTLKEEQKGVSVDSTRITASEKTIKTKETKSYYIYLWLLIPLFIGIYLFYVKFIKK